MGHTQSMRILFALPGLDQGGAERQLTVLAPALQARGHDVTISVAYSGGFYENYLRKKGVTIHVRRPGTRPQPHETAKRVRQAVDELRSLRKLARSGDFDIVHSYGLTTNLYVSAVKMASDAKIVWGIRNSTIQGRVPHKYLETFFSHLASLIIANSNAGKEACRTKGYPMDRIRVIENGIDTQKFDFNASWRDATRRALDVAPDEILIGIVGRLDPVKDHENFLAASSIVFERTPNVKFLVVGRGEKSRVKTLQDLAGSLGIGDRVIWTGVLPDVEKYLNAMDVFVLSSPREGFPNAVAEAMATGVPCVVTDAGDARHIVGDMGLVVPPRSPETLANAIIEMLERRHSLDRGELRAQITDRWSVDRMVSRTEEELLNLLSRSGGYR